MIGPFTSLKNMLNEQRSVSFLAGSERRNIDMKKIMFVFFLLLLDWVVVMGQAQFQAEKKYLNFEINTTPYITGGYFLRDKLALEAGIGLAFMGENETNGFGLRIGLDKYSPAEHLSTFFGGYAKFEINPNALAETFWKGSRLSFGGHWGLNYFILKNFAVAGTIGLELHLNSPKDGDNSANVTTITSGLKARLFF